jgi:hypothetical protein
VEKAAIYRHNKLVLSEAQLKRREKKTNTNC